MKKEIQQTALDKAIGWLSPEAGLRRLQARARMAFVGGYKSSDRNRKAFRAQSISSGSADAEILPWLDALRSDSRDLARKSPLAAGAINTVVTNVVGTGLIPQSVTDRDALRDLAGLSDDAIDAFERNAERIFNLWANSIYCDAARTQTFRGLQSLVFRSALESGDVFSIRTQKKNPNGPVKLALRIIEADRVINPGRQADTATLAGGIRRDEDGAPVSYIFAKSHPGNNYAQNRFDTEEINAFLPNGERQVLHIFTKMRPEQTRGIPYLSVVIEPLLQLNQYTEAEAQAAVISSLFTVFIRTEEGSGVDPVQDSSAPPDKPDELKLGTGTILDLAAGESIETANPTRPNQAFDPFVQAVLRQIGVALELPFEILIKHFTASYSAAQAAIVEAWKFFKERRKWLVEMFCQPVYEAVITEAIARGELSAPGFFASPSIRAAYLSADWIGPPRGSIDQKKEAEANATMEDRCWKTGAEITAEMTGGDYDRKVQRRARENQNRIATGLLLPPPSSSASDPVPVDQET